MHTNPETLALLALGEPAGTTAERHHAADCAECAAEIAELAQLTGIGRAAGTERPLISPAPEVWEQIRAELGLGQAGQLSHPGAAVNGQSQPHWSRELDAPKPRDNSPRAVGIAPGVTAEPARREPNARRWLSLALAAALALVAGIGIGVALDRGDGREQTVVGKARLEPKPQWAGAAGDAVVEVDREGNRTLVVEVTTPRPVPDDRQVWLLDPDQEGAMKNLGSLNSDNAGRFELGPIDLKRFSVVDVSDEPIDDANPLHSGNTIVQGPLSL
jgi:hypothetical protein